MNQSNEYLGEGLTSKVRIEVVDGISYAKKIFKSNITHSAIKKEIKFLESFKHHNIIQLVDSNACENWLMTELLCPFDFFEFLARSGKPFSINSIRYITMQLAGAVQYLHKSGLVHRDIKLENLLVDDAFNLKLCDFGFAEFITATQVSRTTGTLGYLAPELQTNGLIDAKHLKAADVFSLGVCLFTLAYGHPPFRSSNKSCAFWRTIQAGNWNKYWAAVDKTNPKNEDFKKMIQGMLEPVNEKRMTIDDVLNHVFVMNVDKTSQDEYLKEMAHRKALF